MALTTALAVLAAVACLIAALPATAMAQGQTVVPKSRPFEAAVPVVPATPQPPGEATATAVEISADSSRTRFRLWLTRPVQLEAYALADPYRVVVDIPDLAFRLPPAARDARGLIVDYRYGLLAPGRARIVLDTQGPVRIVRQQSDAGLPGQAASIEIEIEPADRVAVTKASPPPAFTPATPPEEWKARVKPTGNRPVIIIDPGHGGPDPGAVSPGDVLEKDVVLAVARQLQAALLAGGRYDVRMTRDSDVFLSLDQRLAYSMTAPADLFVSIHADSVGDAGFANSVRGATVYTLSETASNERAQKLAEKENAADARAGVAFSARATDDQVRSILFDLMRRESHTLSSDFSKLLVANMRRSVAMAREPQRAAAFKVLRQAQSPSVLIELGYMSNAQDAQLLRSPEWHAQVAKSIGAAIDAYFNKHKVARNP